MAKPGVKLGRKAKRTKDFDDLGAIRKILGVHDENIHLLESIFGVLISVRGGRVIITGDHADVSSVFRIFNQMYGLALDGRSLTLGEVEQIAKFESSGKGERMGEVLRYAISVPAHGKTIVPRSPAQRDYVEAIKNHDMVFSIGPAGTGKTYLAMAMAVNSLMKKEYDRIILTRPAVEAGEKLGFLPGSMQEKVNPYLRPLYDALHDMMEIEQVHHYLEQGVIEVAPLAFMRGRTLNSSFVILDEAQNCTTEQMKMFLTRMGFDSKYVVTGDVTQIDLPPHSPSGMLEANRLLEGIGGIYFQYFTEVDVVRHRLVREIIKAYERDGLKSEEINR